MDIATFFSVVGVIYGARDVGHLGGCGITETDGYHMLECTYGSIAECPASDLECETMIYGVNLDHEDFVTEAYNLLDFYRDVGFDKMPTVMSASPDVINKGFMPHD